MKSSHRPHSSLINYSSNTPETMKSLKPCALGPNSALQFYTRQLNRKNPASTQQPNHQPHQSRRSVAQTQHRHRNPKLPITPYPPPPNTSTKPKKTKTEPKKLKTKNMKQQTHCNETHVQNPERRRNLHTPSLLRRC